ncbi:tetratricopeptide repeat protein, partial [Aggregatibacter segnis]|uniref:tetratricopeptide repeat protein n=1 Tax=Aggregatibacter segnis TaxID=739 RepID=UPI0028E6D44B
MSVNDLIKEGVSLFKSNNFDQAIAKFNQALDEIEDKNSQLEEQNNIQFWLGRCYLEQALKVRDITEAKGLFVQAIEHDQEQLKLAKQLTNKQTSIQEQIYAQHWLGRCYLEQAMKVKDLREAKDLFAQAVKYQQEQLKLAKQLTNEQTSIQQQINAESWLGRCYLEQAMKVKDLREAKDLFAQAVKYQQEQLKLAKQLTNEQTSIQQQINAESWLGRCYLEQAMKVKDLREAKDLFAKAVDRHHKQQLHLTEQLTDE